VSRARWQNTYTFGNFHGSVDTLLKYYDAHFYIANWGTVRLGLAFPKGAITPEIIQPYLRGGERYEVLSATAKPDEYAKRIKDMLSRHYSYGREKMRALARRTATLDQRKALAEIK
jgi:hypothetical protein